jgi:hypothetical protein
VAFDEILVRAARRNRLFACVGTKQHHVGALYHQVGETQGCFRESRLCKLGSSRGGMAFVAKRCISASLAPLPAAQPRAMFRSLSKISLQRIMHCISDCILIALLHINRSLIGLVSLFSCVGCGCHNPGGCRRIVVLGHVPERRSSRYCRRHVCVFRSKRLINFNVGREVFIQRSSRARPFPRIRPFASRRYPPHKWRAPSYYTYHGLTSLP